MNNVHCGYRLGAHIVQGSQPRLSTVLTT